jgi:preprotein translocase subunit SecD
MSTIVQQRLLITLIVVVAAFLVAFRPLRLGPFEEYRVELTMRYRFSQPFSAIAKDQPMERLMEDLLRQAKIELAEVETVGEHLLVIRDEAPTVSEALKHQERIQQLMRRRFPQATLVEFERQEKGEKPVRQLGRLGIFKPSLNLRLGLDLQGGSRIVLQCRRAEMVFELGKTLDPRQRLAAQETITAELQRRGLENFEVRLDESGRIVFVRSQSTPRTVERDARLIETTLRRLYGSAKELSERRQFFQVTPERVETVRQIIDRRINKYGVAEPQIYREGNDRIVVEMPGVRNPEEALRLIGEIGELEFRGVPDKYRVEEVQEGERQKVIFRDAQGKEVPPYQVYAESPLVVKGTNLKPPVNVFTNPLAINPRERVQVHLEFDREGARKFDDYARRHVGKHVAIWYDRECISAPVLESSYYGGRATITGIQSVEEANLLKVVLEAGALPVPVSVLWRQSISPTLGIDTIYKSLNAAFLAAFVIAVFMIGYYRLPGLLACVALAMYVVVVLAFMSLQVGQWRPVLTLPGIVGLIISLGMAVDVNVISFERLKEELRAGKPIRTAVELAFDRSWTAILDAHVTILIAAAILYYFGTGPVRGFATTLTVGTLANLFSAFFSVRGMMEGLVRTKLGERKALFQTLADLPAIRHLLAGGLTTQER